MDTEITPGGKRPKSAIHFIEQGAVVSIKNGVVKKIQSNKKGAVELGKINPAQDIRSKNRESLRDQDATTKDGGWIVYSGWKNNTSELITRFKTKWVVPPEPETEKRQVIYLFNGIEDSDFNFILQPVLQWGISEAGGDASWSIANWFVGSPGDGIAVHGTLLPVKAGDMITGIITLEGRDEDGLIYRSSFEEFPEADLIIRGAKPLTWANETLECYRMQGFSEYPNVLSTAMHEIEIHLGGNHAKLEWTPHVRVKDNGQNCLIRKEGSPDGHVELFYKGK